MKTVKNIWKAVTVKNRKNDLIAMNNGEGSGMGFIYLGCL